MSELSTSDAQWALHVLGVNFAALRTVKDDPHGEVFAELRKVMLRASGHEQQITWAFFRG